STGSACEVGGGGCSGSDSLLEEVSTTWERRPGRFWASLGSLQLYQQPLTAGDQAGRRRRRSLLLLIFDYWAAWRRRGVLDNSSSLLLLLLRWRLLRNRILSSQLSTISSSSKLLLANRQLLPTLESPRMTIFILYWTPRAKRRCRCWFIGWKGAGDTPAGGAGVEDGGADPNSELALEDLFIKRLMNDIELFGILDFTGAGQQSGWEPSLLVSCTSGKLTTEAVAAPENRLCRLIRGCTTIDSGFQSVRGESSRGGEEVDSAVVVGACSVTGAGSSQAGMLVSCTSGKLTTEAVAAPENRLCRLIRGCTTIDSGFQSVRGESSRGGEEVDSAVVVGACSAEVVESAGPCKLLAPSIERRFGTGAACCCCNWADNLGLGVGVGDAERPSSLSSPTSRDRGGGGRGGVPGSWVGSGRQQQLYSGMPKSSASRVQRRAAYRRTAVAAAAPSVDAKSGLKCFSSNCHNQCNAACFDLFMVCETLLGKMETRLFGVKATSSMVFLSKMDFLVTIGLEVPSSQPAAIICLAALAIQVEPAFILSNQAV
uniref:Protein kinase domain-containing protein n=1 Tax=Macrostomum lignano TaxID=282301 RepID=A0A1I8IQ28_9PLAT